MTTTSFGRLVRSAALSAALCAAGAEPVLAQADPLANCRYYTKTQADFEQGLTHCRAAIEKYPEDPEARFYGAWCLAETGHWDEAWKSFSWLIERKDSSDKKIRKHADLAEQQASFYYQTHFNRGVEFVKTEKYQEAEAEFAIATKIYPSNIESYLNRGFTQTQGKDLDGALASFESAVAMNPKHLQAQLYYWDALNQKLKVLRNAEARDSTAIDATSEKLGATLVTVLEIPDVKAEDRAAAYMQLADLAFAKGDNQKAIEYVTKATEIAPEKITELYNMGIEFYNADDYGPAIQALRTVMTQVGDESNELWRRSLYVVGLSSLYTADYAGCITSMDKLIALDPGNMDYYLNRGKAHAKAGNESAAAADITKWEKMKEAAATGSSK